MGGDHLWDAIGAIGQVLGSMAVFVTLGYLAVQVRHARSEMQRSLSQGRGEAIRGLLMAQATDERLTGINAKAHAALGSTPLPFVAALMHRAGLTVEEASSLLGAQAAFWNYRLQVIPYVHDLPAPDRLAFDWATRGAYGRPGVGRLFYETLIRPTGHPDAVRYIDDLLAQPG